MQILHTVQSLHPDSGGPARSVPGLAEAAAAAGATVTLWSPLITPDSILPDGVNILRGENVPDLSSFDLIHDHGVWLPFNHRVARAARKANKPRIVSPRGMLEPWALNHSKGRKKLAWFFYQKKDLESASALHATAEAEAKQLRKLGFTQPIHVIPNGINLPHVHPLPNTHPTVVFLSRVHPKKGLLMWVEAWRNAAPNHWRMRVIGPDELNHTAEVRAAAVKAGIAHNWSFEGPLEGEEKLQALSSAEVFVLPTFSENFGIAIAEALALGTPVITTTGTPWEELKFHQCGWWVAPEVAALSEALRQAVASPDRHRMGQRGRTWVREEFAWPGIGQRIFAAYKDILAHHGH